MAKLKQNNRNTQIKLTRHDGAFVLNRGVGIHMLLPPRLAKVMQELQSKPDQEVDLSSLEPDDYVFVCLCLAYLEVSAEVGGEFDNRPMGDFS
jgi:hypothetical protein